MTSSTIAQRQQGAAPSLSIMLHDMQPEIARALPKHLDGDRFARLALTAIRKTPKLANTDPASFFGALLTAAAMGLEPNVNGEAYLVPYGRECQLIVGYQGIVKLFWQHPLAQRLTAEYVCENDEFSYDKGLDQALHHRPAPSNRGKVIGYYAIAELSTGARVFDYFTVEQIEALRATKRKGDVRDPEHWMARKTALKQVLKLMPKATEVAQVMQVDERPGSLAMAQAIKDGDALPELSPVDVEASVDYETGEVYEGEALPVEQASG